jgi:hypothetical protein
MIIPADAPPWAHELARERTAQIPAAPWPLARFAQADLPNPARAHGALIFVDDASGGAVPAFSDGTHWRRCDDRTVIG